MKKTPVASKLRDPIVATQCLVDIFSESLQEQEIADYLENILQQFPYLTTYRISNTLVVKTDFGRDKRIILAGHTDTVPMADNFPSTILESAEDKALFGLGSADMKSGLGVFLSLLFEVEKFRFDVTCIFYEAEEIAAKYNGLFLLEKKQPELLQGDLAIVGEPSNGIIEAGCQGSIRLKITTEGKRAHSARAWLGDNAIHKLGAIITTINAYHTKEIEIDGCLYRESLSVVGIEGGIAGNIVPDKASMLVNYRYAPDKNSNEAEQFLLSLLARFQGAGGITIKILDHSLAAKPNIGAGEIQDFIKVTGLPVRAKYGWTDVARFAALNIPAFNFGPGNPNLAHKPREMVKLVDITHYHNRLLNFLLNKKSGE